MKFIRYALVLALVSSGGLFADTAKPAKGAKYKKIEAKKQTHAKAKKETYKTNTKDRYGKPNGQYKKVETKKHEKGLAKPTTKAPSVKSTAKDRPEAPVAKKTEPSTMQKAAEWLGLGSAGAAATRAAGHKAAGYHIGPRDWHDNFPSWWADRGWVSGKDKDGNWVFAGHRLEWWQKHYPTYYHNVIWPEYKKTTLGK